VPHALLILMALAGFSANSLLTRFALERQLLDPMDFMAVRIVAGAAMLAVVVRTRRQPRSGRGSMRMAVMLAGYAIAFTLAYTRIAAATGALLLFASVHLTMVGLGIVHGERLSPRQIFGNLLAVSGLLVLTAPGLQAPSMSGALLMVIAGACWGVYSIEGRRSADPTATTADNFAFASLLCLPVMLASRSGMPITPMGTALAVTSGAVTSGLAYAAWYAVLPHLPAWRAALVQLAVPVVTAGAAALLLAEPLTTRLWMALALVLGGITIAGRR
jgi:drug/metabolite transporter (DMT)-like permease